MHLAEMGCKQMAEYYAVERSDEYLTHYGIRGMRWGVRKALKRGNSRVYKRQYKKAAKRLARLDKQANNGGEYAKKALIKGAKAAVTGGMILTGATNPGVFAYKASVAGYNAYRAKNTKTAAQKAQKWRDEIEKEFGIDALDDMEKMYRRKRKYK